MPPTSLPSLSLTSHPLPLAARCHLCLSLSFLPCRSPCLLFSSLPTLTHSFCFSATFLPFHLPRSSILYLPFSPVHSPPFQVLPSLFPSPSFLFSLVLPSLSSSPPVPPCPSSPPCDFLIPTPVPPTDSPFPYLPTFCPHNTTLLPLTLVFPESSVTPICSLLSSCPH
ncbi:unnamed protein product [Closterium sp. NIES-54]